MLGLQSLILLLHHPQMDMKYVHLDDRILLPWASVLGSSRMRVLLNYEF